MVRSIIGGAMVVALVSGTAFAAPSPSRPLPLGPVPLAWIVTPGEAGCQVEFELSGRSGGVTPVRLTSDGQFVSLRFAKPDLPSRAFLPIRIDNARFSNLMLRDADGSGELVLSEETQAALRRGATLGVAWLGEEPLTGSLAGSDRGLVDLRGCGAQAASRHRERMAVEAVERERAETEARSRALNEAQLAAIQAQTAAAEAQRRQAEEAAERQRRAEAAATERAYMEARQRAYEDERRRAYENERRRAYARDLEEDGRWTRPRYPYDRY
ncbi:hypothetical protein [Phenylobacterium sp.]|uniref:hypothetical protein n=1 Tax=Phenylobacterium sp. TaxID=1871053 RepID=UPI00301BA7D6